MRPAAFAIGGSLCFLNEMIAFHRFQSGSRAAIALENGCKSLIFHLT